MKTLKDNISEGLITEAKRSIPKTELDKFNKRMEPLLSLIVDRWEDSDGPDGELKPEIQKNLTKLEKEGILTGGDSVDVEVGIYLSNKFDKIYSDLTKLKDALK